MYFGSGVTLEKATQYYNPFYNDSHRRVIVEIFGERLTDRTYRVRYSVKLIDCILAYYFDPSRELKNYFVFWP